LRVSDTYGLIWPRASLDEGGVREKAKRPAPELVVTPTYHFSVEHYPGIEEPYVRMAALARLVAEMFGAIVNDRDAVDYALHENPIQGLNCEQTRSDLDWAPTHSLEDMVEKLGFWLDAGNNREKRRQLLDDEIEQLVRRLRPAY
jgi:hypothetical protein